MHVNEAYSQKSLRLFFHTKSQMRNTNFFLVGGEGMGGSGAGGGLGGGGISDGISLFWL